MTTVLTEELLRELPLQELVPPRFTQEDGQLLLGRCNPGKAPKADGIPAKVLKLCAMELSPILHSIFWGILQDSINTNPLKNIHHHIST